MGIADRDYAGRLTHGSRVSPLIILIGINILAFVALAFFNAMVIVRAQDSAEATELFNSRVLAFTALPATALAALHRPWVLLTHGFSHTSMWVVLGNMVWLWLLGGAFAAITGNKKIVPVYLYGTVAAGVGFLLASSLLPASYRLPYYYGANSGILAIGAAATAAAPGYRLFAGIRNGIPLWVVSLAYTVLSFVAALHAPAAMAAYGCALLAGYLFIFFIKKGYDGSRWMNGLYDRAINLFNPEKNSLRDTGIKNTLFYKVQQPPYKKTTALTQSRVDEILDKINQHGFHALSHEEKDFLQRASREDMHP